MKKLKEWISYFFKKIKEKGHHHFTIMMIPHSEKQIFTFQISNFIIIFFITIILFSILSIMIYFSKEKQLKQDALLVEVLVNNYIEKKKKYDKELNENFDDFKEYEEELYKIFSVLDINKEERIWKGIPNENENKKIVNEKYNLTEEDLPQNIYKINMLKKKVSLTTQHLHDIINTFESRDYILEYIPNKWPVYGGFGSKTSDYGERYSPFHGRKSFHTGVDLAYFVGTPILSAARGTVINVAYKSGYGNTVLIQHKYGFTTLYAHNDRILVEIGEKVNKGQTIALMGKTGRTTGPHVHFEIRIGNKHIDPLPFITTQF